MAEIDLAKLKPLSLAAILLMFVAILSSGILFIYSFKYSLFISLDNLKLLLLAASITAPTWLINCMSISNFAAHNNEKPDENRLHVISIGGSITSISISYVPILIHFYWKISIQWGVGILVVLTVLLFLSSSIGPKTLKMLRERLADLRSR